MDEISLFVRVPKAAKLLSLSRSKTYELVAAGAIPSVRFDAAILIPREWLERRAAEAMQEVQTAGVPRVLEDTNQEK